MRLRKNTWATIFLFIGIIFLFLSQNPTLTGNVISEKGLGNFSYSSALAFIFISLSLVFFIARQTLDVIVIPTGGGKFDSETGIYSQERERVEKALRRRNRLSENGYFVISGYKGKDTKRGQPYGIYKFLRNRGIKPSEILFEGKSHDTLENLVYTLKKVKEREEKRHGKTQKPIKIAFVSYPEHLKRFEDFERQAVKKGLVGEDDFEFHSIRTFPKWKNRLSQRKEERSYENNSARKYLHKLKLYGLGRFRGKDGRIKYREQSPIIRIATETRDLIQNVRNPKK